MRTGPVLYAPDGFSITYHFFSKPSNRNAKILWILETRYDTYPIHPGDIQNHYAAMAGSYSFFPMTAYDEGGIVGHLIIRFTDESKTEAQFGFVMVDDAKRSRGYGTDTLFRDGAFSPNG